jgi:hypothetical protein
VQVIQRANNNAYGEAAAAITAATFINNSSSSSGEQWADLVQQEKQLETPLRALCHRSII